MFEYPTCAYKAASESHLHRAGNTYFTHFPTNNA
uniref:Uncharacterized protein n=1 Tax=Anguilla anguilla TaxID=7936 RepID=A0A0E9XIH9_ANGAN